MRDKRGYTLVEVLVICLLVICFGGVFCAVFLLDHDTSDASLCQGDMVKIRNAACLYAADYDSRMMLHSDISLLDTSYLSKASLVETRVHQDSNYYLWNENCLGQSWREQQRYNPVLISEGLKAGGLLTSPNDIDCLHRINAYADMYPFYYRAANVVYLDGHAVFCTREKINEIELESP